MSSRAHAAAAADTETPVASASSGQARIRPRDDDDAEDEKQLAQSSTHASPVKRIYRHALESIFAMLELQDLTQILAVSRSWPAAVRSMQSIGATMARDEWQLKRQGKIFRPLPPIDSLVASPLLRHIAAIHLRDKDGLVTPLSSVALALLAQHAPNLTSLWCSLTLTPGAPLSLPLKLTSLELTLVAAHTSADAKINGILTALTALPSLSRLHLRIFAGDGVDLSLLAACPSLTDLAFEGRRLSDAQVAQVRSSLGHLRRFNVAHLTTADLARLLQLPHTARWQDIGFVYADPRTGDLLATLPTLTKVDLGYSDATPHADFLSQLPLLSTAKLNCSLLVPAPALLASLLPCTGLTEVDLRCAFNSAQVGTLLSALTNLRTFKFGGVLDTLQCGSSGPAARTLESLSLDQMFAPLPPSELVHLFALQGLRSLELSGVFASLDDAALASLTPPTARLPSLPRFVRVDRAGPLVM